MLALCRDCGRDFPPPAVERRCPHCDSARLIEHGELRSLAIAHVDCDAFYATVEKRDNPSLRDKPVLVGGSQRGVVMACCYIARRYGIRSAMPSAQARRLCAQTVFLRPEFARYREESRSVFDIFRAFTPLVQPVSIDEAYLDVSEAWRPFGSATAVARAIRERVRAERRLTVSVGVGPNRLVAKIASDCSSSIRW